MRGFFRQLYAISVLAILCLASANARWQSVSVKGSIDGRSETSMAPCGDGKICLLGGRGATATFVLDTRTLTWSRTSKPPMEMHHFQAVRGPDGCAWVVGAWTGPFPSEDVVKDIYTYCADTDKWTKIAPIARPRGAGGAVFYRGSLYIVSGNVGGHRVEADTKTWFDRYDPTTKKWSTMPPIPNPRDHFQVAMIGSKMYVPSGRDSGAANFPEFFKRTEKKVNVFDFSTGKWSTLTANFPRPRAGGGTVPYGGTVYVAGGEGGGRAWKEVDVLSGNKFIRAADMPFPRHGHGMYSCNGVIWVAGGAGIQGCCKFQLSTDAFFSGSKPAACVFSAKTVSDGKGTPSKKPTSKADQTPAGNPSSPSKKAPTPPASPNKGSTSKSGKNTKTSDTPNGKASKPSNSGSDKSVKKDSAQSEESPQASSSPASTPANPPEQKTPTNTPQKSVSAAKPQQSSPNSAGSNAGGDTGSGSSSSKSSSNEPVCFPGHMTVELENGGIKTMRDLQLGDRVKVEHPDRFSEVYFFSHKHPDYVSEFVHIETSINGISLQLSPRHFLHVNGRAIEAQNVRIGDKLFVSHEQRVATVKAISRTTSKGLFNPHTLHGDIVVNGVKASTYTGTVHPRLARILLYPVHVLYRVMGSHRVVHSVNRQVLRLCDFLVW